MCKTYTTQNFLCTKTFVVIIWGNLEVIPSHLSCATPPNMAVCKIHRTQNFCAQRHLWYSLGDICRPFQPSHLKNHEFHFFIKLCTKPYLAMSCHTAKLGNVQNIHNSKLLCTKTFVVIICGDLEGNTTFTIQKRWISVFSQNISPSNLGPMNGDTPKTHK